jgi:hypothetical protein
VSREQKRGPGRPPFPNREDVRDVIFAIRLSASELEQLERAAAQAGEEKTSDWARDILLAASANKAGD